MSLKKTKKSKIFISVILSFLILYFSVCIVLYFFEPISYKSTDLKIADYSFDMYKKFSYENNNEFYIKQLNYTDVATAEDDIRIKYVNNTILAVVSDSATNEELTTLFNSVNAEICGYLGIIDLYQLYIPEQSYDELQNICSALNNNRLIEYAIIDIFEETPASENESESYSEANEFTNSYNLTYYDILKIDKMHSIVDSSIFSNIRVGVFDIPVYYSHNQLNVINADDYNDEMLDTSILYGSASHGTHISGIIGAYETDRMTGVIPGACIYSENATNNSLSYWIAAITNMIVNENIKAINISMGFNSYITVSAALGDASAINYITNENNFTEAVMMNILNEGYDFVICVAAGNEADTELYKTDSPYFAYGDKELLDKYDIFNIFKSKPDYADAQYGLCFNMIENKEIKDRIIIVTSCDDNKKISSYASLGDRVDIAAPGDDIYSTGYYFNYEYISGTSMATPFVTATAALLLELDTSLSGADVKNIIISSCDEYASSKGFNYPILNIFNAVDAVLSNK